MGWVPSQTGTDGTKNTVAFASQTLCTAKRKYSVADKEALACGWAEERWCTSLWRHHFTLRTDCQALTTLLTTKHAGLRVVRWSVHLMSSFMTLYYSPLPTRLFLQLIRTLSVPHLWSSQSSIPWSPRAGLLFQRATTLTYRHTTKSAMNCQTTCLEASGCLPCINFFSIGHESHQGMVYTKQQRPERYWWPNIDNRVLNAIRAYYWCQSNDMTLKPCLGPLQPVTLPWQKIDINIVGPFETATNDCRFAITVIDC